MWFPRSSKIWLPFRKMVFRKYTFVHFRNSEYRFYFLDDFDIFVNKIKRALTRTVSRNSPCFGKMSTQSKHEESKMLWSKLLRSTPQKQPCAEPSWKQRNPRNSLGIHLSRCVDEIGWHSRQFGAWLRFLVGSERGVQKATVAINVIQGLPHDSSLVQ